MQAVQPKRGRAVPLRAEPVISHPPLPPLHELFREHAPLVFRLLRRLGVSDGDVDDVCQEVFLAVHRQLPSFEGRSSLRTWIYAIAVRRAASHVQRSFRRREHVTAAPPEDATSTGPAEALERQHTRAALDALLRALDEDQRRVFVLYELEELSMREVAAIVGCPLQTAYGRLHAARRELRRAARARGIKP